MDTKDTLERIKRLLNERLKDGITKDCVFEDIKYINSKLERGEKFEKMYYRARSAVYSDRQLLWLEVILTKLEAEFLGSSPTTVVVDTERIYGIINEVERGAHGYAVDPEKIIGML